MHAHRIVLSVKPAVYVDILLCLLGIMRKIGVRQILSEYAVQKVTPLLPSGKSFLDGGTVVNTVFRDNAISVLPVNLYRSDIGVSENRRYSLRILFISSSESKAVRLSTGAAGSAAFADAVKCAST